MVLPAAATEGGCPPAEDEAAPMSREEAGEAEGLWAATEAVE